MELASLCLINIFSCLIMHDSKVTDMSECVMHNTDGAVGLVSTVMVGHLIISKTLWSLTHGSLFA